MSLSYISRFLLFDELCSSFRSRDIEREGVFKKIQNQVLKKIYDRQSFGKCFRLIQVGHEDSFGFLVSSVAQLEAEISTYFLKGGGYI